MRFTDAEVEGVVIVDLEPHTDERGFFARAFCASEFAERGLEAAVAQTNVAYNALAGTLRGLHLQRAPAEEVKLVRCTRGAILDVAVDVRESSATYLRHVAVELTAENRRALYVPRGFAHGYQTLTDDAEVTYQVSTPYTPGFEAGLRHDDPALDIAWPRAVTTISDKDRSWPLLDPRGASG